MSKQDTHFFNVFSMVIGLLVAVAIALFALARVVASHTQDLQVLSEIDYGKAVAARLQPPSAEAVSGQDNSALAIKAEGPAAGAAGSASSSALHASKSGSGDLTPHLSRLLAGCNFQASLGQNPQLRNRGTNGRRTPHRRNCGTPLSRMAFTARAVEQLYFGANRRLPRRIAS